MSATAFGVDRRAWSRDLAKLERKLGQLRQASVPQATSRALTATANRARTQTVRELAKVKQVPSKLIRARVKAYRAFPRKLVSTVWLGAKKHIPIEQIPGARLTKAGALRAGRLSVKVFRATMPNGKEGLYVRRLPSTRHSQGRSVKTSPNLPIEHPVVRLRPEADQIIAREAGQAMRVYFPRELERLFRREVAKLTAGG